VADSDASAPPAAGATAAFLDPARWNGRAFLGGWSEVAGGDAAVAAIGLEQPRLRAVVQIGLDAFLEHALEAAQSLIGELDLPADWVLATDPFFRPTESPGYLVQLVTPMKREAVYLVGGTSTLAIASVNRHGDHFGETFGIEVAGEPATSGCTAFGLERWPLAITDRHGADPDRWPSPAQAAARVLNRHG